MNIGKINDGFAVCEQISANDIGTIAAAGYKAVICNRPDKEGWGQPSFAEIEAAAKAAGLQAAYMPVTAGGMSELDVRRFAELMRTLPGPVLGYCRSGARAAGLYQAAQSLKLVG